jgi:hypothetical protein
VIIVTERYVAIAGGQEGCWVCGKQFGYGAAPALADEKAGVMCATCAVKHLENIMRKSEEDYKKAEKALSELKKRMLKINQMVGKL